MATINRIFGKGIELGVEVEANNKEMIVLGWFLKKEMENRVDGVDGKIKPSVGSCWPR